VKKISRKNDAVSEIVGEMLMLTMVLIILAVFSSSFSNYLPPPRDPSVTIKMSAIDPGSGNVTLYHIGGDIIKRADLIVIVENSSSDREKVGFKIHSMINNPEIFGLGDTINISAQNQAEITLTTSRTVLFKGTAMGV
jgi:FlaG/FlaF family flagellin (archaellin)